MLCGDDGVVVDFDLGIELNPIGEGAVGNPVFLLDFVVGFPRSIEVYDGFLEFRCVRILLFRGHLFLSFLLSFLLYHISIHLSTFLRGIQYIAGSADIGTQTNELIKCIFFSTSSSQVRNYRR